MLKFTSLTVQHFLILKLVLVWLLVSAVVVVPVCRPHDVSNNGLINYKLKQIVLSEQELLCIMQVVILTVVVCVVVHFCGYLFAGLSFLNMCSNCNDSCRHVIHIHCVSDPTLNYNMSFYNICANSSCVPGSNVQVVAFWALDQLAVLQ